ncbi:uncharacterized protein PV09_04355 [Verruconis gallopava]|uniref:Uncharacterized protein n=1 Tax=Verruconis gallopava TaxID=253628 RepID=A0A0D1YVB1_9PEZI|nr:uncharacterized protein PV09_04355 [Verruconis gallopava]KIW04607.1 hypothetical protein PV09_04355 [Verruconis gallopava]
MFVLPVSLIIAVSATSVLACNDCYGSSNDVVLTRRVKRMQPDALGATTGPKGPLEWGQINFLHTTDTHGWLEGHLKERNYGADWGDFASFTKSMKSKARHLGVDLLLIDTGDLHDGAGLSDATDPNGLISNPIWENIDYDLLTIGNHELYVSEIAFEHFNQFSKVYGDRYVNSNVKILNQTSGKYETPGVQYRYFTTERGLRIMAFGVLFDFTGNSNASQITKAAAMVKEQWFIDAVNYKDPIDMFIVIGHNPVRTNASTSTLGTVYQAIRAGKPDTPVQFFGGHTHIRDFFVYDNKATGIESGRYCETLGWVAIDGLDVDCYKKPLPSGLPTPTQSAVVVATGKAAANLSLSTSPSSLKYARRYLDWNRLTFAFHATGSQDGTFDTQNGKAVTATISGARNQLNLTELYGCAPQTYCMYCKPFGDPGNIYTLIPTALAATVVNQTRKDTPRFIIINTGSIRFDLVQGPFTKDDSFIVSPFTDAFQYIQDVPYSQASKVLGILNAGPFQKRDLVTSNFGFDSMRTLGVESQCIDPPITHDHIGKRSYPGGSLIRRQTSETPGYTTTDDFGTNGDDTPHSKIPTYTMPNDIQANASMPTDGSTPETVDLIFLDFIASYVLNALNSVGGSFTKSDIGYYMDPSFTTNSYLQEYAKTAWQQNMPNCPVGQGVGS